MKCYAVAFMSFGHNNLSVELIKAKSIIQAIGKHSLVDADWLKSYPNNIKQLRMLFLELDCAVDVIEIPKKSVPQNRRRRYLKGGLNT